MEVPQVVMVARNQEVSDLLEAHLDKRLSYTDLCIAFRSRGWSTLSLYEVVVAAERARQPRPDPRDPDYTRSGIFINHNCWKCQDGKKPCAKGNPNQCEFPRARND